nr:HU family DNA-binding protein [uncultured Bacteroides sp.]
MFYKKSRAKIGGKFKWFPRACVLKHPVDTQELAEAISRKCTVTPADVHAVIRSLPEVMAFYMENGRSVHMDGLGSFFYKLSCAGQGVDTPEEVSAEQVQAVRVQFIPERSKQSDGYHRVLGEGVELVEFGK